MNNGSSIKIYIHSSKPYYYPGEQLAASILLDVLEKTNTNKMQIIVKGKEIVDAIQKRYIESYDDNGEDNNQSESEEEKESRRTNNKTSSSEEYERENDSIGRKLKEAHHIFKYNKVIQMTSKNYMEQGRYTYPFEVTLPEKIPGSFLFLEHNTYIEIIYTIKVKLNQVNIKEAIPIIIRQKEKLFNYPKTNEYTKSITGCCFDNNESVIKLGSTESYTLSNKEIKLNVLVNNKKCGIQASPFSIELYQKIKIYPKNRNKKLKITKQVGEYKGKSNVLPGKSLNRDVSFLIDIEEYKSEQLKKTKAIKYFRHKDVIPFLCQSIKSDFLSCEYEAYVEVQYPNWSIEELGVFLQVLVYPPEKGVLSKSVAQIATEFNNSILNKKVFLSSKIEEDDDPDFRSKHKKQNKTSYRRNNYDESSDSDDDIKQRKKKSLSKSKGFGSTHLTDNHNSYGRNDNEFNEKIVDSYNKMNDNMNNKIFDNSNNYKYFKNNDSSKEKEMTDIINNDGSFGHKKGRSKNKVSIDTNSNNFKKDFSQNYLDDELDEEFLDKESNNQ